MVMVLKCAHIQFKCYCFILCLQILVSLRLFNLYDTHFPLFLGYFGYLLVLFRVIWLVVNSWLF